MQSMEDWMDIGIALPQAGRYASREAIVRVAQEAERIGYASVWVLERLLRPTSPVTLAPGSPPAPFPEHYATVFDPLETLAYVAAKTERIKLGTSVIVALWHVPVLLARRLATLDQLSGGRVIAGLGQGFLAEEFEAANVPPRRRGSGMEEFVAALRATWGPDPVSFSGRFYRIPESQIGPKPVQPGGPPLIVGGFSPPAIERAARIADGFNAGIMSWEGLEQAVDLFRGSARAAGRDPDVLQIVVRANVRISEQPWAADRPPLSGSPEQISEELDRLRGMGINHVFFDMNFAPTPIDEQLRLMERLHAAA
jgi:probable F420-dependent oxidoreductase